jgi:hypothetical protein
LAAHGTRLKAHGKKRRKIFREWRKREWWAHGLRSTLGFALRASTPPDDPAGRLKISLAALKQEKKRSEKSYAKKGEESLARLSRKATGHGSKRTIQAGKRHVIF